MSRLIHLFLFLFVLALAACTSPAGPTPGAGETQEVATPTSSPGTPGSADPLANTQWTLESIAEDGAEQPVVADTTITLEFGNAGQAGGTGGCNSFGTTYEVQDNTITFGDITSTLIACEGAGVMDQENLYFQALQSAGEFEMAGDRLQIEYGDGQGVLNFVSSGSQATGTPEPGSGRLCSDTQSVTDTGWQICHSQAYGFEVQYPAAGQLVDQSAQSARIDLPFTPGTNLSEKYLEVTVTEGAETCSSPLAEGYEPGTIVAETVQLNDLEFTRETGHEGAAGSIYEWVAYSTGRNGLCVSLGFVLHSSNPDVFSTPPPLFDSATESQVFEQIVSTFQWLETGP